MDLFFLYVACLTAFVNCFVKQFAICLGVVVILLLNVIEVFSVDGGALLDKQCMVFQRMCSFHRFCLCFYMSEIISSFKSLRTGSQVFALIILFRCVIILVYFLYLVITINMYLSSKKSIVIFRNLAQDKEIL